MSLTLRVVLFILMMVGGVMGALGVLYGRTQQVVVVCSDAVRAGVAMLVTSDQAMDLIQHGNMEEALAAIVASEKFEEEFHQLAKGCLK